MTNSTEPEDIPRAFISLDFLGDALDPVPLVALLPLKGGPGRKKGTMMGTRPTPTGSCFFSTVQSKWLTTANENLAFVLDAIEHVWPQLEPLMAAQSLTWKAVLFENIGPGQRFGDIDPALSARADALRLPLMPKGREAVTFVDENWQIIDQW